MHSLEERGVDLKAADLEYILEGWASIEVTEVDINNDQLLDLRMTRTVGSARCQKNYFFIRDADNKYAYREFSEFDPLTTEGGFCGSDTLLMRRIADINYLVAIGAPTVVFQGTPDGMLTEVCSFQPHERWSQDQMQVADLVRQKFPEMPPKAEVRRPELERLDFDNHEPFAKEGEMVWTVVVQCRDARYAYALLLVHPIRHDFEVIIEPGGESSSCD